MPTISPATPITAICRTTSAITWARLDLDAAELNTDTTRRV
jgi:hypothetical protein